MSDDFVDDLPDVQDKRNGVPVEKILAARPDVDLSDPAEVWEVTREILKNENRDAKLSGSKNKEEFYKNLYDYYYEDEVAPFLEKKKGGRSQKTTHLDSYVQRGVEYGPVTKVETSTKVTITVDATGQVIFSYEKDPQERLASELSPKFEGSDLEGLVNPSRQKSTKRPDDLYDLTLGDVEAVSKLAGANYGVYDVVATIIDDAVEYGRYSKDDPTLALNDDVQEKHRFDNFGPAARLKAKKVLAAMQKYLEDLK